MSSYGNDSMGDSLNPLLAERQRHSCLEFAENEGWWAGLCRCGEEFGPMPSADIVVDELMAHAAQMVRAELAREEDASILNALKRGKSGDIVAVPYDQLLALRDIVLNAFLESFEVGAAVLDRSVQVNPAQETPR